MLKKTLLIICLSWLMLCFFQLNVSASDSLSDELWKWTYSHKPHRSFRPPDTRTRIYLTYISDEILDAWSKEETETIKKRISTLRKTIKEKKIALYLMRIDKYFPGYHDAIDLRNLKQQIYLQITEATNKKYYPVAVSQNLVNFLKTKQNYMVL